MASSFLVLLVLLLLSGFSTTVARIRPKLSSNQPKRISLGSSLFPSGKPTSWLSPSGRFAFGFYPQNNKGFLVGILLDGNSTEATLVWTAFRDDPPLSLDASIQFTIDGRLLLQTQQDGEEKPIANVPEAASSASMLDSGNFILYNSDSKVIWQSFDFPTDTILGGQYLSTANELFSSLSETNYSTGQFRLAMQNDGSLVLYNVDSENTLTEASWATNTFTKGNDLQLFLNSTGVMCIRNTTGFVKRILAAENSSLTGTSTSYLAKLDSYGVFGLYSHSFSSINGAINVSTQWSSFDGNRCNKKGFCGYNSYCKYVDFQAECLCLPGFDFVDPSQTTRGCARSFAEDSCGGRKVMNISTPYDIIKMDKLSWFDLPYSTDSMTSQQDCGNWCLQDCFCYAAMFANGLCKKRKVPLRYVIEDKSSTTMSFFKVSASGTNPERSTIQPKKTESPIVIKTRSRVPDLIIASLCFFALSGVAIAFAAFFIYRYRVVTYTRVAEMGNLDLTKELTLRLFSHKELERATDGFKHLLGKGSFGAVYKGVLCRSKMAVAVKRLEKLVEEGEREFKAEMRAIGRANHRNLVRLLGYCAENSDRLLVYEYMQNGSLADLLFKAKKYPLWDDRVRIALDIAKGIHYLHEECEIPIIHCDIKPHNILMDDYWTAKICDFGLAKFLMPDQTRTFTVIRGTRGYLAPDWNKNEPISVKVDVFSFGIVLLETVCCRRSIECNASTMDEIVLCNWVYKCFTGNELNMLVGDEDVDMEVLERMVKVGLWCIQDEPFLRPSMKNVIRMLEGIVDVPVPPFPGSSSNLLIPP